MPELPEVETSRQYVEEFCLGTTITRVNATEQGGGPRDGQFDDIVIGEGVTAKSLKSTLEGRKIVGLKRRGKQMWFVLDKPPHPLFHFGMTGAFTVKGEKRHKFVKFKVSEEWPPRFAKLELQMSNGTCLALTDPRRLARVRLRAEPEASPPISLLGPDPLTHPLSLEEFAAALVKPTAPIKAVLLAQDRVVSGVGNWVADEVCFQARVHPAATCNTLSPEQVAALHAKLLSVCREACEARADYTVFPKEWLFHHRWGKGKNSEGVPRVSTGQPITFDVVGGRTTAIVPALQKKGLLLLTSARGGSSGGGGGGGSSSVAAGKKPPAQRKDKAKASGGAAGAATGKGKGKAKGRSGKRGASPKAAEAAEAAEGESGGQDEGEEEEEEEEEEEKAGQRKKEAAKRKDPANAKAKKEVVSPATKKNGGGGGTATTRGGARGKKSNKTKTGAVAVEAAAARESPPAAAGKTVKAEPVAATARGKKAKATRAAGKTAGGTSAKPEEQEAPSATAPAKRGRGREEPGTGGRAVAKGKRAKTGTAVAGPGGGASASAARAGGRRSPRLST